jgi:hypothetical protein
MSRRIGGSRRAELDRWIVNRGEDAVGLLRLDGLQLVDACELPAAWGRYGAALSGRVGAGFNRHARTERIA